MTDQDLAASLAGLHPAVACCLILCLTALLLAVILRWR